MSSSQLPIDKTVAATISEGRKKKKKRKKRGLPKKGFLRKTDDILDVSLNINAGDIRAESAEIVSEDNRVKWAKTLTNTSLKNLWREFQQHKNYKPPSYTVEAYERNESKNRYNDILCMDATRVRLKARKEYDDYIHASWISMPDNHKYICTQGPIAESVEDFWHMVFTEKSNVIVMLCNFVEEHGKVLVDLHLPNTATMMGPMAACPWIQKRPLDYSGLRQRRMETLLAPARVFSMIYRTTGGDTGNHEKCYPYFFAELNLPVAFGKMYNVTVKECYEPDPTGTIIHKLLEIEVLGTVTEVHHLAYGEWPDHTAPCSPLATVVLLKLARILSNGNPITVHCSAGIGRTATFVGIDYAVQKIVKNARTSMIEVLKDLRNQRLHAIQSPIQYTFLHICVLEVFIQDGVITREGNVAKFFETFNRMLIKYQKTCERQKGK